MLDIVLATRNPGKVIEIERLLGGMPVRLHSLSAFPDAPEIDEDQPTLEDNAVKKASVIATMLALPALADDTGLEVAALGGRPGVHSARYAGPNEDPAANRSLLLTELEPHVDRSARFRTVIAFVDADQVHLFEGVCSGHIGFAEKGDGGFGYDALFIPDGDVRTFAELPLDEKNAISHRGNALKKLAAFLTERLD